MSVAVNLSKGGVVDLNKNAPGLSRVRAGLGWDPSTVNGESVDLDLSAFLLASNGKVGSDGDFVFYNNEWSTDKSVQKSPDSRGGEESDGGDDESMPLDLSKVSTSVQRIAIVATIDQAQERGHKLSDAKNSYIRIVDHSNCRNCEANSFWNQPGRPTCEQGLEILRYDLSGDFSKNDAVIFGEFSRTGSGWEFKAIGEGRTGGLLALCKEYGVNV